MQQQNKKRHSRKDPNKHRNKNNQSGRDNRYNNISLTAPYRFVDIPDYIGPSPWEGEPPSHIRPEPDGICGELSVEWTFETPFLVGGKDNSKQVTYTKSEGKEVPVIPGATIRGALRNILEIATAARMVHIDKEAHFSFRNFSSNSSIEALTWLDALYPMEFEKKTTKKQRWYNTRRANLSLDPTTEKK